MVLKSTPWIYHPFFKYSSGILLVLAILFLFSYDITFLAPIFNFISILFLPIVFSLFLYYLLRPIVKFLESFHIPRWLAIIMLYLVIAMLIVLFIAYMGPVLINQVSSLANTSVETISKIKTSSQSIMFRLFHINFDQEIEERLFGFFQQMTSLVSRNFIDFVGFFAHIAMVLAVIPFIVFYLLKDDEDFHARFIQQVPDVHAPEVQKIVKNMDKTLSNYINGLVIVSVCLGILLFIGYTLIGLDYALFLSLISVIFTTIPFLGPFLAITPAIFVALSQSPFMVVKVIIVFIILQQAESNLLSPHIIGQRLNIHPLTIILLLLAAGSLYGLLGLLLATPLYALAKVLIENLYKIYLLHYSHIKKKLTQE